MRLSGCAIQLSVEVYTKRRESGDGRELKVGKRRREGR